MLRREEMLDQRGRLAGYRFSFNPRPDGGTRLPPEAYLEALLAAKVHALAERRLAVLAVPAHDWTEEALAAIRATHTVVQVAWPSGAAPSDDWLAGLRRIRATGAGVALSCAGFDPHHAAALALATHGFVDFVGTSVEAFEGLVKRLHQAYPVLILVAQNVSSWPERRLCVSLGVEFSMGGFLTTVDEQDTRQKLTESRLVLMDMLNLIRSDGDAQALAGVAKRDPGVAMRLLSMANSPAHGLLKPLTGIDQAIMVLGREVLYRWLAVSIFRAGADSALDETLLEVALARARFLELAALSVGSKQQADELFLVGLLSFVDTLLGMSMDEAMAVMSLPPVVRDVLVRSEGPYVAYLILALSVEKCLAERATQLAGSLSLGLDDVNDHRNAALLWAEEAVR